ncbi:hypothetical protein BGZ95_005466 [Linnemannia exigua]|uniref:Uncharacterized protein n=1 Tax=Linnemannia exigua TaxID=604196 RepID=A0AAD4D1X5_9FUNG|nr:hypothetical protein BGZ95_005466 [Linnemannia exigua]
MGQLRKIGSVCVNTSTTFKICINNGKSLILTRPPRDGETDHNHHHRPRYSIKARDPPKHHDPPTLVEQHTLKPMTPAQEKHWRDSQNKDKDKMKAKRANTATTTTNKKRRIVKVAPRSIDDQSRTELVRSMAFQHPLACLTIGTLSANTKRALGDGISTQFAAKACVKDITNQALSIKCDAQSFIGRYVEAACYAGLTDDDRSILSAMCPPVSSAIKNCDSADEEEEVEINKEEEQQDNDDDDDDNNNNSTDAPYRKFFQILLAYLYSRKRLPSTVVGRQVTKLFSRAAELQVASPARRQWSKLYSTSELLQSVSSQLFNEVKKMHVTGNRELEKKLNDNNCHNAPTDDSKIKDAPAGAPMIEESPAEVLRIEDPSAVAPTIEEPSAISSTLEEPSAISSTLEEPPTVSAATMESSADPPRIDGALPAIENFFVLNRLVEAPRKIAPLSPIE